MTCDCYTCKNRVDYEQLPNGFAKGSDGKMYRRFKQTGANFLHLTPVDHDAKTSSGSYPCDFYEINPAIPDKAIR